MTRLNVIALFFVILCLSLPPLSAAESFPAKTQGPAASAAPPAHPGPQRFYGYVPPPPIRDTWPGGYRVIFHELREILLNHIAGHY
jgi:hypothetical protein